VKPRICLPWFVIDVIVKEIKDSVNDVECMFFPYMVTDLLSQLISTLLRHLDLLES
jgi:hypothetical protein